MTLHSKMLFAPKGLSLNIIYAYFKFKIYIKIFKNI